MVIAGGLTTSGITALSGGTGSTLSVASLIVIVLGVLVGLVTGVTQIWKPAERATTYANAETDLREEGWQFVQARGRYADAKDADAAWNLFVDRALAIQRRAGVTVLGSDAIAAPPSRQAP